MNNRFILWDTYYQTDVVNNKLVEWSPEKEEFFKPWFDLGLSQKVPLEPGEGWEFLPQESKAEDGDEYWSIERKLWCKSGDRAGLTHAACCNNIGPYRRRIKVTAKTVHPMCAAMSRTQLKYVSITHDGINATFSFGDYPKYDLGGSSPAVTKTTDNGVPLPPCPKCGAEPMLRTEERGMKNTCWVQCSGCANRTIVRPSELLAIEEWKRISHPAAGGSELHTLAPGDHRETLGTPPATPSVAVGAEQPELPKFPAGVEFCSSLEGQAKAWMSIWEWCCKNGLTMGFSGNMNGPQLIANWILELKKHPAAVVASGPVADCSSGPRVITNQVTEWSIGDETNCNYCGRKAVFVGDRWIHANDDGAKGFCERQTESEDTPPHNPVLGPVVGTATVKYHEPAASPDVSGEIRGLQYALEWIAAKRAGNPKLKAAAWEMLNDMQTAYEAAVARLQDGESINSTSQTDVPAESPDDWVMITDPEHVIRKCDQISDYWTQWYGPSDITAALGKHYKNCGFKLVRCRRKDLPPVPVVPNTRTVTLREYHTRGYVFWSSDHEIDNQMGRTCECEVPE